MNTSLEHLPEHKQKQLREITGIIVKAVDTEKVILFGSHATGRWVEHRYTEGGIIYEYISDYDILVITKSGESRKDYEVQDLIENRCVYKTPVTVITHDIDFVNRMLREGQYFFADIEKEGILLYDAAPTDWNSKGFPTEKKSRHKRANKVNLIQNLNNYYEPPDQT